MPARPPLVVIAALSENRVIGRDGDLPWHLPADLAHFKRLTMGHPIVMGRRTFDSVGRALPGRTTIVVTRQQGPKASGVVVAHSLDEAIDSAAGAERVYIAGGAEIYKLALPRADRMVLTVVHARVEGDTFFPAFDPRDWHWTEDERHDVDEQHAYPFSFMRYERCTASAGAGVNPGLHRS